MTSSGFGWGGFFFMIFRKTHSTPLKITHHKFPEAPQLIVLKKESKDTKPFNLNKPFRPYDKQTNTQWDQIGPCPPRPSLLMAF
jgi:hypothetical protein